MHLQPKTILFCDSDTDEKAVQNAKDYIAQHGLTSEQVRIVKRLGVTCVETKDWLQWEAKRQA